MPEVPFSADENDEFALIMLIAFCSSLEDKELAKMLLDADNAFEAGELPKEACGVIFGVAGLILAQRVLEHTCTRQLVGMN